ncbi:MAG: Xaa-Pro peptidase family protein [Desulfobacterales bacterium]|nr:Xaa-Pro peptidase family protein [Desulfobacterales bacterium]
MYDTSLNTPKSEIDARIHNLQATLNRLGVDAALILQKTDLFYFSGTIQQANLYVPASGTPILMVNRILERAEAESSIERIVALPSPSRIPEILRQAGFRIPARLGLELDVLPTSLYFRYRDVFNGAETPDISTEIRRVRAVKSAFEIAVIREAAQYSDRVAACVPALLREGMTEIELAGRLEAEARRLGHQGVVRMRMWGSEMFYGHLLSGPSGGIPSYQSSPTGGSGTNPAVAQGASFRRIQRNEPVMLDYVFSLRGYLSDHTRLFSLGPIPEDLVKAHSTMLALQVELQRMAKPGAVSGSLFDFAWHYVSERGYANHFMGANDERVRFIGHGVGLELDEFPFLNAGQTMELEENMVIALEPKLVFPGRGVVGIENTHLVTKTGLEQLGQYPGEITVV